MVTALASEVSPVTQALIDAMAAHVAIIDSTGTIIAVNRAWCEFGANNGAAGDRTGVGTNYLGVCSAARGDRIATATSAAIARVLRGEARQEAVEYACHSADEERWFVLEITRLGDTGAAVVSHTNVTQRVLIDREMKRTQELLLDEKRMLEARVAERTAELRGLAAKLIRIQEEERTRVARDLHDELGQSLTELNLGVATLDAIGDRAELTRRVAELRAMVARTIQSMQRVAAHLRPALLDRMGLVAALEVQVSNFATRTGVDALFRADRSLVVRGECASTMFRVVQEALTNIARHARATRVRVHLRRRHDALVLTVRDNGIGIGRERLRGAGSLGLTGMRERAWMIGASIRIRSARAGGTVVRLRLSESSGACEA